MTEFTDFMDKVAKVTTETLKDEKKVLQTVLIVDVRNHLSVIALLMDKAFFKEAIRQMLSKVNAKFYVVVTEAWYLSVKMGEKPSLSQPIRENPERKEGVTATGYSRDGQKLAIWIPFERGPNGDIWLETPTKTAEFEDNLIGNLFAPQDYVSKILGERND
jgi:hypothetical protein